MNPARHILPAILIAVMLLPAVLPVSGCRSKQQEEDRHLARERWSSARAQVLLTIAEDHYRHGNFDQSRRNVEEALAINGSVPGLFVLKAKLDLEQNELRSAMAAVESARLLAPQNPEPDYLAGIIAERWQQPEEALEAYELALSKQPTELAYLLAVGEMLIELGELEQASERLAERLRFFESSAALRELLGQVYEQTGQAAEAVEAYRQAVVLAPQDSTLRQKLAGAMTQAQRWREAAEVYERLLNDQSLAATPSLHVALGECRLQLGQPAAARASFLRAARLDDRSVDAWLGLARACIETEEFHRAEYALGRAMACNPVDRQLADLHLLRGFLRLRQQMLPEASAAFFEASRLAPDDAMAVTMYGYCLQLAGRYEDAAFCYGRALSLDPNEPLARQLLGALAGLDGAAVID